MNKMRPEVSSALLVALLPLVSVGITWSTEPAKVPFMKPLDRLLPGTGGAGSSCLGFTGLYISLASPSTPALQSFWTLTVIVIHTRAHIPHTLSTLPLNFYS
jgi:hypothetical protein